MDIDLNNITQLDEYQDQFFEITIDHVKEFYFEHGFVFIRNKDFCLFKDFPFRQLIVLDFGDIYSNHKYKKLSCAFNWIVQYHHKIALIKPDFKVLNTSLGEKQLGKCNFTRQYELCHRKNFQIKHSKNRKSISLDLMLGIEFALILSSPLVNLFGIFSNAFVISILLNKKFKKEFEHKHYKYLILFSASNIIICSLQIFTLINECQQPFGLFCSKIRRSVISQYYKIVFIEFFSHFFISISNWVYVAFALNRLSLVGNQHQAFMRFLFKLDIKKFMGFTVKETRLHRYTGFFY